MKIEDSQWFDLPLEMTGPDKILPHEKVSHYTVSYHSSFPSSVLPCLLPSLATQVAASLLSHVDSFLKRVTATEVATMKELANALPGEQFNEMMEKAETK